MVLGKKEGKFVLYIFNMFNLIKYIEIYIYKGDDESVMTVNQFLSNFRN